METLDEKYKKYLVENQQKIEAFNNQIFSIGGMIIILEIVLGFIALFSTNANVKCSLGGFCIILFISGLGLLFLELLNYPIAYTKEQFTEYDTNMTKNAISNKIKEREWAILQQEYEKKGI